MNLKPLADRVIVEQVPADDKTAGGIIIPDVAKERPNRATVVAAGEGTADDPMKVKAGDIIIYGKFIGTQIEHDGKEYVILKQSEILAIIEQQ